jgi:predicted DNA-binding transcriptional regulator AlpA
VSASRVWQAIGVALIEHMVMEDLTLCGQRPWSANTDPTVDPSGNNTEEIWFADHEAPVVIPCGICMPGHKDERWHDLDDLITPGEIATLIGFAPSAVSNWRQRNLEFPKPIREGKGKTGAGALFSKREILAWFQVRFENVMKVIRGI